MNHSMFQEVMNHSIFFACLLALQGQNHATTHNLLGIRKFSICCKIYCLNSPGYFCTVELPTHLNQTMQFEEQIHIQFAAKHLFILFNKGLDCNAAFSQVHENQENVTSKHLNSRMVDQTNERQSITN